MSITNRHFETNVHLNIDPFKIRHLQVKVSCFQENILDESEQLLAGGTCVITKSSAKSQCWRNASNSDSSGAFSKLSWYDNHVKASKYMIKMMQNMVVFIETQLNRLK